MAVRVVVIGECLVDEVAGPAGRTVHRGGSAANVAVALARLGGDVTLHTHVGDDAAGRELVAGLETEGVHVTASSVRPGPTSRAVATIRPDGSASYAFDLRWDPVPVDVTGFDVVHVCSFAAVLEPGAAVVRSAAQSASALSYDVNVREVLTGTGPRIRAKVEDLVARCALVKASDEDIAALYDDPASVPERWLALGARAVVVTRGADGASWHDTSGTIERPAQTVTVVDTIGAGDTVQAALLLRWHDPDRAATLDLALAAAAVTVSRPGAQPPRLAEIVTD